MSKLKKRAESQSTTPKNADMATVTANTITVRLDASRRVGQ